MCESTIVFHYIYPPLSISLGVPLVIVEGLYLKTRNLLYERMTRFWIRIFALIFGRLVLCGGRAAAVGGIRAAAHLAGPVGSCAGQPDYLFPGAVYAGVGLLFLLFLYLLNKKIQHGPEPEPDHPSPASKRQNPLIAHDNALGVAVDLP